MEITLPSFVDSPEWRIAQWKSYCSTNTKSQVLILAGTREIFSSNKPAWRRGSARGS